MKIRIALEILMMMAIPLQLTGNMGFICDSDCIFTP